MVLFMKNLNLSIVFALLTGVPFVISADDLTNLSVVSMNHFGVFSSDVQFDNLIVAQATQENAKEEEDAKEEEEAAEENDSEEEDAAEESENAEKTGEEDAEKASKEEEERAAREAERRAEEERKRREEEARIAALNKQMFELAKDLKWDAVVLKVKEGAQINAKDENGYTPLFYCVIDGDYTNMLALSNANANFSAVADDGMSVLHAAVLTKHKNMVDYMLKTRAISPKTVMLKNNTKFKTLKNSSPLYDAARICDFDMVSVLLNFGADPNVPNAEGLTPLHQAAARGNLDMVKALVKEGAEVNARAADGKTPLHYACSRNRRTVASFLLEKGKNADPNAYDKKGVTPLHLAAQAGSLQLVQLLIKAGAKTDTMSVDGATAIVYGAKYPTLIRFFSEKANLSMNTADIDGNTVLHIIAEKGDAEIVRYVLYKGGNESAKNKKGDTPLQAAIDGDNLAAVKVLLNMEVEVSQKMVDSAKNAEIKSLLKTAFDKQKKTVAPSVQKL